MMPGDCFTIEPCLVQGINSRGFLWDDGWTISTEVSQASIGDDMRD
jgi:methionyl aminopeptidase